MRKLVALLIAGAMIAASACVLAQVPKITAVGKEQARKERADKPAAAKQEEAAPASASTAPASPARKAAFFVFLSLLTGKK